MSARLLRVIALIVLIVATLGMLTLMAIAHEWWWFGGFSIIALTIVTDEALSYFIGDHKTISTRYGLWIKQSPVLALTALGLFFIAMTALVVHLIAYAF